jgi:hypothetical protein
MKRLLLIVSFSSILLSAIAQIGGTNAYIVADMVGSARVDALGGRFISVWDDDLNLARANPSLLDSSDAGQLTLNYASLFSGLGVNQGSAGYAIHKTGIATFMADIRYLSYGSFAERDEFNTDLGSFNAADYLVTLGAGRSIDSLFRVGASVKFIYSQLGPFTSVALATDLSGTYRSRNEDFSIGLILRNIGTPITTYVDGDQESLPFGIDIGFTKRLRNSPLRLSVTLSELQNWSLDYIDPADVGQTDPLTGEVIPVEEADFAEQILLHTNASMEFLLGEHFHIRMGYDFRRRSELALDSSPGGAGLSWGMGLRLSKFHLSYARVSLNQAAVTNHIGLAVRWADFRKAR